MSSKSTQASLFKGLFFAMLSGVTLSLVSVIVKQMKNLHPGQLALYRLIATFVMTMPETLKIGQNPLGPPGFRFLLVLRGIFGGLSIFLNFIAFRYLGLGEASAIIFGSPVFVTIFAKIFFKEPCSTLQSIAVLLTVVGIIFTTKLPARLTEIHVEYTTEKIYGLLAAIFSLFCVTATHLCSRKVRSVDRSIATFSFSWVGGLVTAFLTALLGNFQWPHCGIQRIYILLLALLSYGGQMFLVVAFQCEYAGPVATVRAAADIGPAFVWQIVIFHDVPDSYGIIGSALILFSIILISLGKWLTSLKSNLFSCKKFKFI